MTDPRRERLLREYLPKMSASLVAKAINLETGSAFSRNAIIGKALRTGLKAHISGPIRRPSVANPRPKRARGPKVLKLSQVAVSEPFNDELIKLEMQPMSYFDEWPNNRCRYPVGEVKSPDFYFCGADDGVDVNTGKSFCRFHAKICHTPARTALRAEMAGPNG